MPWSVAAAGLNGLGASRIPNDPMLNYWLRMAGGGFTMIGVIFTAILVAPKKYAVLIPLMAYLSIAEGIILLVSGLRLGLPPFPFWGDTSFCIGIGIGLLLIQSGVKKRKFSSEQARVLQVIRLCRMPERIVIHENKNNILYHYTFFS